MTELWLDGSRYQGTPDFNQVRAAGVTGVIWNDLDPGYSARCMEAHAALLKVGTYHYLSAGEDASNVASAMCQKATATGVPMVIMALDIEEGDGDQSSRALAFLQMVEQRSTQLPWIYTGGWFVPGHLTDPALARYPLWDAQYQTNEPTPPPPWTSIAMWQFSSSGQVPGISGTVDEDFLYSTTGGVSLQNPPSEDEMTRLLFRGVVTSAFWFTYGRAATDSEMTWWCDHATQLGAGGYEWALEEMWAGSDVVGQDFHNALTKLRTAAGL